MNSESSSGWPAPQRDVPGDLYCERGTTFGVRPREVVIEAGFFYSDSECGTSVGKSTKCLNSDWDVWSQFRFVAACYRAKTHSSIAPNAHRGRCTRRIYFAMY